MILEKIKNQKNLTTQEREIVSYIVAHPESVFEMNAKQLAEALYVSSPTIIRFCKKIGFKGYPDFQLSFIKENVARKHYEENAENKEVDASNAPEIMEELYQYVVKETKQLIDQQSFSRIVTSMVKAKRIDFYASDINYPKIQQMCLNLNTLDIQAQAFNTLNQHYLNRMDPKDCVSVVVSHSGNNPTMIKTAYALRKHNVTTIAITSSSERTLELVCNESLYLFYTGDKFLSLQYGLSLGYLLDILYACIFEKKHKL